MEQLSDIKTEKTGLILVSALAFEATTDSSSSRKTISIPFFKTDLATKPWEVSYAF